MLNPKYISLNPEPVFLVRHSQDEQPLGLRSQKEKQIHPTLPSYPQPRAPTDAAGWWTELTVLYIVSFPPLFSLKNVLLNRYNFAACVM